MEVYVAYYRTDSHESDQSTIIGVFTSLDSAKATSKALSKKEKECDHRCFIEIIKIQIDGINEEIVESWEIDNEMDQVPIEYLSNFSEVVYEK